jgi:hypothetical protein
LVTRDAAYRRGRASGVASPSMTVILFFFMRNFTPFDSCAATLAASA